MSARLLPDHLAPGLEIVIVSMSEEEVSARLLPDHLAQDLDIDIVSLSEEDVSIELLPGPGPGYCHRKYE